MENESPYKYQAANLVEKIKKIIKNSDMSPEKKSDEIMTALREEYILLPSSYINSFLYTREQVSIFNNLLFSLDWIKVEYRSKFMSEDILNKLNFSTHATINPRRVVGEDYPGDLVKINGNSFGPFNPQKYFNPENIRILWLLKEPDITRGTWFKDNDRGEHPQASSYDTWEKARKNPTIKNLIQISSFILNNLDNDSKKKCSDEDTMNTICILEVNHFPGLAFNSTDSNVEILSEWAKINSALLHKMIRFYSPTIIISDRDVLSLFLSDYTEPDEHPTDIINFMCGNPYYQFCSDEPGKGYPHVTFQNRQIERYYNDSSIVVRNSIKRNTKLGPIALFYPNTNIPWIGWYHPSARTQMSNKNKEYIGVWIATLINHLQENNQTRIKEQ